ncbi:MAG: rhomboid family intramembrane serine protease [Leptospirales bacterium]
MENSNWNSTQQYENSSGHNYGQFAIELHSHQEKKEFEAYLGAAQIIYSEFQKRGRIILVFLEKDYPAALHEWKQFKKEQKPSKIKTVTTSIQENYKYSLLPTLLVLGAMVYFHFIIRDNSSFSSWLQSGGADNIKILSGEFFRTITALCLHSNLSHLMNNVLGILILVPFLIKETGSGWGWLLALLAGILGNYANAHFHAIIKPGVHLSIGASTLLFGILGLLGSKRIRSGWKSDQRLRESVVIPVLALFALLAMMGISGQNTDIFAHLFGMLSGILLGVTLGKYDKYKRNLLFQSASWIMFVALIFISWVFQNL